MVMRVGNSMPTAGRRLERFAFSIGGPKSKVSSSSARCSVRSTRSKSRGLETGRAFVSQTRKTQAPHCRHVEKYRRSKCLTERRKTSLRLSPEAVHVPTCRRPSQCAPPRERPSIRPLDRAEILLHLKCSPETTETILRARRSPARWWHGNSGRACIQSAIRFPPRTLVKDSRQQRRASFPGQFWFVHDKISDRQGNASCRE